MINEEEEIRKLKSEIRKIYQPQRSNIQTLKTFKHSNAQTFKLKHSLS